MRWRVLVELTGGDGTGGGGETLLATGERVGTCHTATTLGLTLTGGRAMVAALLEVLVQAQAAGHCAFRRQCPACGALRSVKDDRPRKLVTSCGVVALRARPASSMSLRRGLSAQLHACRGDHAGSLHTGP